MRILVVGGTQFIGRAFVELAAGHGHQLTLFHRGTTEPGDLPDVEHLHGDRDGHLKPLEERTWDAVLDSCAYYPRAVTELASVLEENVGHYTLVSTLSVHSDDAWPGATEDAPLHSPPFPDTEVVDTETYGPLKVACELEARRVWAGRSLIVRPGYVVGPHDPTDRFTYYVRRAAAGGEMLAPGPPDGAVQVVDARDLGAFILDRIEAGDTDVYGVVGPGESITMGDVLDTARALGRAQTELTWVPGSFLESWSEELERWFPIWEVDPPGGHSYDASRARAAGLRHRTLAETVADTLAWDEERGLPELRAGLPAEKEAELLQTFRQARHGRRVQVPWDGRD